MREIAVKCVAISNLSFPHFVPRVLISLVGWLDMPSAHYRRLRGITSMIKRNVKLSAPVSVLLALLCGFSAAVSPLNNNVSDQAKSFAVNVSDRVPSSAIAPSSVEPVFDAGDYLDEIAAEGKYTWKKEKFPLKVFIKPDPTIPGFKTAMPDMVRSSFDEWTEAVSGKVSWAEVSSPAQADITVCWTDEAVDHGRGTEGGRTKTFAKINHATNKGTIDRAEMTLLTRLPYGEGHLGDAEMKRAYLHEVGHAYGLTGHSTTRGDVMYYAVGPKQNAILGARDIATLNRLYNGYPELARGNRSNGGV